MIPSVYEPNPREGFIHPIRLEENLFVIGEKFGTYLKAVSFDLNFNLQRQRYYIESNAFQLSDLTLDKWNSAQGDAAACNGNTYCFEDLRCTGCQVSSTETGLCVESAGTIKNDHYCSEGWSCEDGMNCDAAWKVSYSLLEAGYRCENFVAPLGVRGGDYPERLDSSHPLASSDAEQECANRCAAEGYPSFFVRSDYGSKCQCSSDCSSRLAASTMSSYTINPETRTVEECAEYCGNLMLSMYGGDETDLRHFVSNQIDGNNRECHCHYSAQSCTDGQYQSGDANFEIQEIVTHVPASHCHNSENLLEDCTYLDCTDFLRTSCTKKVCPAGHRFVNGLCSIGYDAVSLGEGWCEPDTSAFKFTGIDNLEDCKIKTVGAGGNAFAWSDEYDSCILSFNGCNEANEFVDSGDANVQYWHRYELQPKCGAGHYLESSLSLQKNNLQSYFADGSTKYGVFKATESSLLYEQATVTGQKCKVDGVNIIQDAGQGTGFDLAECAAKCISTDGFIWKASGSTCYCTTGEIRGCETVDNSWKQYVFLGKSPEDVCHRTCSGKNGEKIVNWGNVGDFFDRYKYSYAHIRGFMVHSLTGLCYCYLSTPDDFKAPAAQQGGASPVPYYLFNVKNVCEKCPAGRYQDGIGQMSCKKCPADSVINADQTGCNCLSGSVLDASGTCVACSVGKYAAYRPALCNPNKGGINGYSKGCDGARNSKYSDGTWGGISYTYCTGGHPTADEFNEYYSTCCEYVSSTDSDPAQCADKFELNGYENVDQCKDCGAGLYQNEEGKSICKNCADGKHQDEVGQTACDDCASGKYTQLKPEVCKSEPTGMWDSSLSGCDGARWADGLVSLSYCDGTSTGFDQFSTDYSGDDKLPKQEFYTTCCETTSSSCNDLPFMELGFSPLDTCAVCPHGRYQKDADGIQCTDCPAGYVSVPEICDVNKQLTIASMPFYGCAGAMYSNYWVSSNYCRGETGGGHDTEARIEFYSTCCEFVNAPDSTHSCVEKYQDKPTLQYIGNGFCPDAGVWLAQGDVDSYGNFLDRLPSDHPLADPDAAQECADALPTWQCDR